MLNKILFRLVAFAVLLTLLVFVNAALQGNLQWQLMLDLQKAMVYIAVLPLVFAASVVSSFITKMRGGKAKSDPELARHLSLIFIFGIISSLCLYGAFRSSEAGDLSTAAILAGLALVALLAIRFYWFKRSN